MLVLLSDKYLLIDLSMNIITSCYKSLNSHRHNQLLQLIMNNVKKTLIEKYSSQLRQATEKGDLERVKTLISTGAQLLKDQVRTNQ